MKRLTVEEMKKRILEIVGQDVHISFQTEWSRFSSGREMTTRSIYVQDEGWFDGKTYQKAFNKVMEAL